MKAIICALTILSDMVIEATRKALTAGENTVRILGYKTASGEQVAFVELSDRAIDFEGNIDPSRKYEWKDEHKHLATVFGGKNGTIVHRFKLVGFKRFNELTEKEQTSGKYISCGTEGYAVEKKTMKRVIDETRTAQCRKIIGDFAQALGGKNGENVADVLMRAYEAKQEVTAVVVEKEKPDGNEKLEISYFKKAAPETAEDQY